MRIGLGIDTGGTYTDSVLLDLETGQVIRKEKALTTYPNLEVGIADALNGLMFETLLSKIIYHRSELLAFPLESRA